MSIRIVHDKEQRLAVLVCDTSGLAFGPVIGDDDYATAEERAEMFLADLPRDARSYDAAELLAKWTEFRQAPFRLAAEDR